MIAYRILEYIAIIIAIGLFVFALSGCSRISTAMQNISGVSLEAYYSQKTKVVCFTTSSDKQENIYCLPQKDVDTNKLSPESWEVI